MRWTDGITRSDIPRAIVGYNGIGAEWVAAQSGYRATRRYWLVWEKQYYPSVAIVGIAAGVTRWERKLNGWQNSPPLRRACCIAPDQSAGRLRLSSCAEDASALVDLALNQEH